MRSISRLCLAGAFALGVTGCGGPSPSPTTLSSPTASPSVVAGTPVPAQPLYVWAVSTGGGVVVRTATSGGVFHTVATLPSGAVPLAAGGHHLLATFPVDNHLHGLDLLTGAVADYGGAKDYIFFGGAFAPDGHRAAYVRATSASEASLRVVDTETGTVTQLRNFPTTVYDVPFVWNANAMGAVQLVGYADAGAVGVARLDPATGQRLAHTDSSSAGPLVAGDASHVADATHSDLGDAGDSQGGPGPQGPFNTLRLYTVGGNPAPVLQEAHHNITVLALNADGSTAVFVDDSAAGGFAGISLSADFGLFTWSGGAKHQLAHYGDRWDAATFVDASTFIAVRHTGATEQLVRVTGAQLTPLDTVNGDGPAQVYYVAG